MLPIHRGSVNGSLFGDLGLQRAGERLTLRDD
jgi:hypothetical protein